MKDACRHGLKAVSNRTRLRILEWLKDPRAHFGRQDVGDLEADGVCVSLLRKKTGLSQSTTSEYLDVLARAGFVQARRRGPWTYYKRDEDGIRRFLDALSRRLT